MLNSYRSILLTALLLSLLTACTAPVKIKTPTVSDRFQEAAQTREAAGDHQGALDYYLRAAAVATTGERQGILLQAAANLIELGNYERALAMMDRVTESELTASQRQHYDINRAKIAHIQDRPGRVLMLLQIPPATDRLRADFHWLRAEAYQRNKNFIASIHERIALDPLLADPGKRLKNHTAIWVALTSLADEDLQALRIAPPPDPLSGWVELAELTRLYLQQPEALEEVIPHWEMRYPGHPASEAFAEKLAGGMRIAGQPPRQLALLLPLSGKLASPAAAIREGILAAYYEMPTDSLHPTIKIYDVGSNPESIMDFYQQAVSDGAQFIIGPLRKEAVQILASQSLLPVPVLALNRSNATTVHNTSIYQFGLAPEDEAREVARRAWHDGQRRAIALMPQGNWGERLYAAFLDEWQQLGGQLLEMQSYNPDEMDHRQAIMSILNLDSSKARHQKLVRLIGQKIEYEPRRRQDVDFIFMLATPRQARLLRPQLSFHRASRVPIYATSHVYAGQPDATLDADINGVFFCDIPWVLEPGARQEHLHSMIQKHWPDKTVHYDRFFALGIDAWQLVPYVEQLGNDLMGAYQGVTGNLTLDSDRYIHRSLRWAQFKQGRPALIETSYSGSE